VLFDNRLGLEERHAHRDTQSLALYVTWNINDRLLS
jgi:hypothetical protein